MANKNLFQSIVGALTRRPDTKNEAGAPAFSLTSEQALAQYAATGCLNGTFYATDGDQLRAVLALADECDAEFVAKTAVYARSSGSMKDMPALLCATLAVRDGDLLAAVFPRVVDSGKMLRNFVQIVRSGVVGRKSLGTLPRRLVRQWLAQRSGEQLFHASLGSKPSLADIIKMVHPKPADAARANLYAYLIGKPFDLEQLPAELQQFEHFKSGRGSLPDVNFQFLSGLPLTTTDWRLIAQRASWTTLRMNLNTFLRHGVFECDETTRLLAERLADPTRVRAAKAFPYQLMTTLFHIDDAAPTPLREALARAAEIATTNVPALPGRTVVAIDVSGSMHSPVTGHRKGSSSKATCLDAAAVLAAAVLRRNPGTEIIPFHTEVCRASFDASQTIVQIAQQLRAMPSGGTNCSAALADLNRRRIRADTVIYFSDNQSWADTDASGVSTGMLREWRRFKRSNPAARLVCIDVQPYGTVQTPVADDVTHVGGFSDQVFDVLRAITSPERSPDLFVDRIRREAI